MFLETRSSFEMARALMERRGGPFLGAPANCMSKRLRVSPATHQHAHRSVWIAINHEDLTAFTCMMLITSRCDPGGGSRYAVQSLRSFSFADNAYISCDCKHPVRCTLPLSSIFACPFCYKVCCKTVFARYAPQIEKTSYNYCDAKQQSKCSSASGHRSCNMAGLVRGRI